MKEVHIPEIIQVLNKGMLLLGIKGEKLPDQLELQLIVAELRNHYTGLTIKELVLAFTLAARNQLDYNSETYQAFSVFYLNKMLSSYARWVTNRLNIEKITQEVVEPKKIISEVDEDEMIKTSFDSFNKFKKWDAIFNSLGTFNILNKRGLISLKKEDLDAIVTMTEEAIKQEASQLEHLERKELLATLKDDEAMELNCRRMAVAQYFNKIIRDERNKG